jgi:hypothetical protein
MGQIRYAAQHWYSCNYETLLFWVVVQKSDHFNSFAQKHLSGNHDPMHASTNDQEPPWPIRVHFIGTALILVEHAAG